MKNIEVLPGDIFCTTSPMWFARAVNAIQQFNDIDDNSTYSHSGIIISTDGETSEALWTIKKSHIKEYENQKVLIGRYKEMNFDLFSRSYKGIEHYEGGFYPVWRLAMHLVPPIAKYLHFLNKPVCSEWVAKFLCKAGIFDFWAGVTPNYLADMIKKYDEWDVVFEGDL